MRAPLLTQNINCLFSDLGEDGITERTKLQGYHQDHVDPRETRRSA